MKVLIAGKGGREHAMLKACKKSDLVEKIYVLPGNCKMEDATRVNDIFSRLAAITASDTGEIASALTRTASIAQSAGMDIEQTSAFLTQMIETTRESPEIL